MYSFELKAFVFNLKWTIFDSCKICLFRFKSLLPRHNHYVLYLFAMIFTIYGGYFYDFAMVWGVNWGVKSAYVMNLTLFICAIIKSSENLI